jgi:hypothetical protein
MTRLHLTKMVPTVVLLLAAIVGTAVAGDPAGMPSTNPPPPSTGEATDAAAQERIATLKKFVAGHLADENYRGDYEDASGRCKIESGVVHLAFRADGVLHCRLGELAEGDRFEVHILTFGEYVSGDHYVVSVTPGSRLGPGPVHGSVDDVKAVLGMFTEATPGQVGWWKSPLYGPYHAADVTITITLSKAGVANDTKLTVAPLYVANVSVVGVAGPGATTYSVADGMIAPNRKSVALSYFFGLQLYPLSWRRNGDGRYRSGRYFSDRYQAWPDHISLVLGVSLDHPTQAAYVGLAVEVHPGISLTAGWQPRKVEALQAGHMTGEMIPEDSAPVDHRWDLRNWGVGLAIDGTLLKPLTAVFGT